MVGQEVERKQSQKGSNLSKTSIELQERRREGRGRTGSRTPRSVGGVKGGEEQGKTTELKKILYMRDEVTRWRLKRAGVKDSGLLSYSKLS